MARSIIKASPSTSRTKLETTTGTSGRLRFSASEEKYQLLWVDENVNELRDNIDTQKKLRRAISQLKTFDNIKECEKHVYQLKDTDKRIVLIVSGKFGRELIPRIHDMQELNAFYVYCMNKDSNRQWAKKYGKVRCFHLDKLFQ